jgi:hypothetical protein
MNEDWKKSLEISQAERARIERNLKKCRKYPASKMDNAIYLRDITILMNVAQVLAEFAINAGTPAGQAVLQEIARNLTEGQDREEGEAACETSNEARRAGLLVGCAFGGGKLPEA